MNFTRGGAAFMCGLLALAGCASDEKVATGPTPYDKTVVKDCYTVDLFTVATVEVPSEDVPAEWAAFSGAWGSAAWDGKWCHDLHVLKIEPDGDVMVMDMHAPYEPWAKRATAFRRKGHIGKDGHLRVTHTGVVKEYWVKDGRLYGLRKEGEGQLKISMLPRVNTKF